MRILSFPTFKRATPAPLSDAERRRRALLAESDELLEQVELLRLHDQRTVPTPLRSAILSLHARAGCLERAPAPLSPRWAHELVFSVQQKLMSANPRRPSSHAYVGRGPGMPITRPIREGLAWKLLVLPPAPALGDEEWWFEMVELTLERALDRWAYARHHAQRAARSGEGAAAALDRMRTAWANYWDLREQAELISVALTAGEQQAA